MRWPGAGRRRPQVAVDLGTARTVIQVAGRGVVVDEPSLVAYGPDGSVLAVGHQAWAAAAEGEVRLEWPVRRGLVVDPVACVHLLRSLMFRAGVVVHDGQQVVTAAASSSAASHQSTVAGVVASASGGQVVPVATELAAAVGAGIDVADEVTNLVCDVGAGVVESAAVSAGTVLAATRSSIGLRDFEDRPERVVEGIVRALRTVLDRVPERLAGDLAGRPVALVGGGGLHPEIASALTAGWGAPVVAPARPRHAVVRGLDLCTAEPVAHAG